MSPYLLTVKVHKVKARSEEHYSDFLKVVIGKARTEMSQGPAQRVATKIRAGCYLRPVNPPLETTHLLAGIGEQLKNNHVSGVTQWRVGSINVISRHMFT